MEGEQPSKKITDIEWPYYQCECGAVVHSGKGPCPKCGAVVHGGKGPCPKCGTALLGAETTDSNSQQTPTASPTALTMRATRKPVAFTLLIVACLFAGEYFFSSAHDAARSTGNPDAIQGVHNAVQAVPDATEATNASPAESQLQPAGHGASYASSLILRRDSERYYRNMSPHGPARGVVVGQVRNLSTLPATNLRAVTTFCDAHGKVVDTALARLPIDYLATGQASPYRVTVPTDVFQSADIAPIVREVTQFSGSDGRPISLTGATAETVDIGGGAVSSYRARFFVKRPFKLASLPARVFSSATAYVSKVSEIRPVDHEAIAARKEPPHVAKRQTLASRRIVYAAAATELAKPRASSANVHQMVGATDSGALNPVPAESLVTVPLQAEEIYTPAARALPGPARAATKEVDHGAQQRQSSWAASNDAPPKQPADSNQAPSVQHSPKSKHKSPDDYPDYRGPGIDPASRAFGNAYF